jgi:transglutaminase-like putative cysteine protease
MSPGDIASLVQSGEIAFRAQFTGVRPPANRLYWRAIVLADFDGRVWHAVAPGQPFLGTLQGRGAPWDLSLTLEPHQRRWLFTPGLPEPLPAETSLARGLQWLAKDPVNQRKRWAVRVFPDYRHLEPPALLSQALALPEGFNPRAVALARSWRAQDPRPQALVDRALSFYRETFSYTLRPPLLGLHGVDDFLFASQRGFCEHFAGSFVFLMRAAGVPARVVTGYLGGEVNPLDGHVVVRQSDAHAWAEVWMGPGQGWVRVDPTASISPARVELGIGAALPAAEMPASLARLSLPWLQGMRHAWEMLNNGWNQWILGYGQDQQLRLLARLSPDLASTRWLASASILAGALGLGLLAWFQWRGSGAVPPDKAARAWHRVEGRLARIGLAPLSGEAPRQYVRRVASERPDLASDVEGMARHYLEARYGGHPESLQALERQLARFRPARQAGKSTRD